MTKSEMVDFMAEEAELTKADATRALDALMNGVIKGLKKDAKVTLTGFATFEAKNRPARTGRNPRTGEPVAISARIAVTIRPGSKLKDALN